MGRRAPSSPDSQRKRRATIRTVAPRESRRLDGRSRCGNRDRQEFPQEQAARFYQSNRICQIKALGWSEYRVECYTGLAIRLAYYGENLLAAIRWKRAIGDRCCLPLSSSDCRFEIG